jgi:hypothetical protein
MRVLWDKGRNMYAAFFLEIEDALREVGGDNFAHWCLWELEIGLMSIRNATGLLQKIDAKKILDATARARLHERYKKDIEKTRAERAKRNDNENDNATKLENAKLRARVAELEEQLARANETANETKPITKGNGGRPCKGDRPMTGYERLKAFRARQRTQ